MADVPTATPPATPPATPRSPRSTGSTGPAREVFRPRSAVAAAVVGLLVALAWAWSALHDGDWPGLARQAPAILLACAVVHAVLVRPSVEVGPAGVRLRNALRDVDVPWAALAEVRTRYALTLVTTDGRRFAAWAAPASGRHTDARLTRGEARAIGADPAGDLPTASASTVAASGAVAAWIAREWCRWGEDAPPEGPADRAADRAAPAARTHVARPVLGTLVGAILLTAATALA